MITDINNTEIICFDSLSHDPKSVKVCKAAYILEHVEQVLTDVDPNKKIKIEIYRDSSHLAREVTFVMTEIEEKIPEQKKLKFGFRKSPELLALVMYELQDRLNLFVDRSMVAVFVRMATCEDLGEFDEKIYLKCKTNLFSYIRAKLEPFFTSFTPANIGRSGLFVSKKKNRIRANSLYNTTVENLHERILIDTIFKKML